jgi:hypothetical protein
MLENYLKYKSRPGSLFYKTLKQTYGILSQPYVTIVAKYALIVFLRFMCSSLKVEEFFFSLPDIADGITNIAGY